MAEIRLNYDEAFTTVTNFRTGAGEIETMLSKLKSQLTSLQGTWSGAAALDFDRLFQEYDKGARQMNDTLKQLTDAFNNWASGIRDVDTNSFKS